MSLKEGTKNDQDKVRLDLVSPLFIYGTAEVLTFGAKKYEENNWAKGINFNRVYRAAIGHMHDWWMGEELDQESGKPHLWHAACCLMFLVHYTDPLNRSDYLPFDNRPMIFNRDKPHPDD